MTDALRTLSPFVRLAHHFPAGPGWYIPPRVIFDHLLLYTRDGSGWLTVGGEVFRIRPRSLFAIPPGVLHETTPDPDSPNLMYNLHFDFVERLDSRDTPIGLPSLDETLACTARMRTPYEGDPALRLPVSITSFAPAVYETLFHTILGCTRQASAAAAMAAKGAMLQLLAHLYENKGYAEHRGTSSVDSLRRLDHLPAFIEEHLQDSLSVGSLAAACHMSEPHFRRSFRSRFGIPPAQYVARSRLATARHLLTHEPIPIKRIAELTGFQSVHYFTRAFSAAFGCPPAVYRARYVP